MNGDQSAEAENPPPETTEAAGANGADTLATKRKKDGLKPIITTEGQEEEQKIQSSKSGCVFNGFHASGLYPYFELPRAIALQQYQSKRKINITARRLRRYSGASQQLLHISLKHMAAQSFSSCRLHGPFPLIA